MRRTWKIHIYGVRRPDQNVQRVRYLGILSTFITFDFSNLTLIQLGFLLALYDRGIPLSYVPLQLGVPNWGGGGGKGVIA